MPNTPKIGSNRLSNRGNAGKGRPVGSANRITRDLRAAILGALESRGGQAYLERIAEDDPRTFCALLGKVLPTTLAGDADSPHRVLIENTIAAEIMQTIGCAGRFVPPAATDGRDTESDEANDQ